MPIPTRPRSRFSNVKGILFAADLPDLSTLFHCVELVAPYIDAIKLGNVLLYAEGIRTIVELKSRFQLPIVADLKLTDVTHICSRVVELFTSVGTDAIILSAICGREVLSDAVRVSQGRSEIWTFTEFTNDSGLIDEALADLAVRHAIQAGVAGFQVPGNRPHRVEAVRDEVGSDVAIVACGIGAQGGAAGAAIEAGANLEIIGRAIYAHEQPSIRAAQLRNSLAHG